ncbi:MAG: magnesium protoporphyrin IX methyltransferase [Pseudomonadota bacterium]
MRESYLERRDQLTTYFDQTAAKAWQALTSTDPVNRIRRTVRAGRDDMRRTLLDWLPDDLRGKTLLDAGCGTGSLSIEAAKRGATVVGIDVAANLIEVARERAAEHSMSGSAEFRVGDMLSDAPAEVDYIVAMDSLIHYERDDVLQMVQELTVRARHAVVFTSAPWTPLLGAMHFVGRLLPRQEHRAPAIVPLRTASLMSGIDETVGAEGWRAARTARVNSGFYISQAIGVER